ncbi:20336_t:CDS:2, partial [Dentiscutata erythropus]
MSFFLSMSNGNILRRDIKCGPTSCTTESGDQICCPDGKTICPKNQCGGDATQSVCCEELTIACNGICCGP